MAKFLTTTANSYYIEDIIIKAEASITIVTPFLKLNNILIDRLNDANRRGVKITLIYGKNELLESQKILISQLNNIAIYFCKNLHAKCYHNERLMIISSMNLYEFSERNNREMGILIEKQLDNEIFEDALKEIESIINSSLLEKNNLVIKQVEEESNESNSMSTYSGPLIYLLLYKSLKSAYPNVVIKLSDFIEMQDFPRKGINVKVSGCVDFRFENCHEYLRTKTIKSERFNKLMPETRFFWNTDVLQVYFPKYMKVSDDEEGQKKTIAFYLKIIRTVFEEI